jgi:hypothetical protein
MMKGMADLMIEAPQIFGTTDRLTLIILWAVASSLTVLTSLN